MLISLLLSIFRLVLTGRVLPPRRGGGRSRNDCGATGYGAVIAGMLVLGFLAMGFGPTRSVGGFVFGVGLLVAVLVMLQSWFIR